MPQSNYHTPTHADGARDCDQCGAEMRYIGEIPRNPRTGRQTSVFRCFSCNNVVSVRN
jgi:hypothetical protein